MAIKELPYKITTSHMLDYAVEKWCNTNIGSRWTIFDQEGVWTSYWGGFEKDVTNYHWFFKNEKDAILFALRWGS